MPTLQRLLEPPQVSSDRAVTNFSGQELERSRARHVSGSFFRQPCESWRPGAPVRDRQRRCLGTVLPGREIPASGDDNATTGMMQVTAECCWLSLNRGLRSLAIDRAAYYVRRLCAERGVSVK